MNARGIRRGTRVFVLAASSPLRSPTFQSSLRTEVLQRRVSLESTHFMPKTPIHASNRVILLFPSRSQILSTLSCLSPRGHMDPYLRGFSKQEREVGRRLFHA